jgi:predicted membrane chloride channel (bestrophin family)
MQWYNHIVRVASYRSHPLMRKAALVVVVVVAGKFAAHWLGWEIISLNPLFSGIVAANVFLMGFLLSGVLTDYKESERLPGELAASIEAITDEVETLWETKQVTASRDCLRHLLVLVESINLWFSKKESTSTVILQITKLNHYFAKLDSHLPANFVVRLKQEQSNLRRMIIRIHTIRETSFIPSGYVISETITLLIVVGLILAKIDPFYESLFFVGLITFLFSFLGLLIRDLDNPFGYYDAASSEDVSLKPLADTAFRLRSAASEHRDCRKE